MIKYICSYVYVNTNDIVYSHSTIKNTAHKTTIAEGYKHSFEHFSKNHSSYNIASRIKMLYSYIECKKLWT